MSKVSRKILLSVAACVTLIIVAFLSYIEYKYYNISIKKLQEEQRVITEGQSILLSDFLYKNDEEKIYLTLSGIISNPIIAATTITDSNGKVVFAIGDIEPNSYAFSNPITYFEDGRFMTQGKLHTYAVDSHIVASLTDRIWFVGTMLLVLVVSIVIVVAFTVNNVVDKPIRLLESAIKSEVESHDNPLVWEKNDEMGLLINEFNELNHRLFKKFDGLRTELHENELLEAERLKSLTNAAFEGLIIQRDSVILNANNAVSRLINIPVDEVIGRNIDECLGIENLGELCASTTIENTFQQHVIQLHDKSEKVVEVTSKSINYGGETAFVVAMRDVTDRIKTQEKITFLAHHDALTGLYNRFKFSQELNDYLNYTRDADTAEIGAVMFMDLDGFKGVNDLYGHGIGDKLLAEVAARLKEIVQISDLVARFGGDEFVLCVKDLENEELLSDMADAIIYRLSAPYVIDNNEIKIGVSIGIASFEEYKQSADEFIKRADLALYEVKRSGKGSFQHYRSQLDQSVKRRLQIENQLQVALDKQLIEVHFQPQAVTNTRKIIGFEALARWNDPLMGTIGPSEFIPIAEQIGQIQALGEYILKKACQIASSWPNEYKLAVNLSAAEFMNPDLVKTVKGILKNTGFNPEQLEFEITETAVMKDEAAALASILELKSLGIRIAIDDFGTGYSSLSLLKRFPFDRIKIDKSFIQNLDDIAESALIVRAIINLSHSLNIDVIAEGVETEAELETLKLERCSEVQGYLIGRPVSPRSLHKYMSRSKNVLQFSNARSA